MADVDTEMLKQLKSLSPLSGSQLDEIARNLSVRTFAKGEAVFSQEDEARLVYLLISGAAGISYNTNERQTIVGLVPPGEFFGLDSLVPDSCHPFGCDAFETSKIGSIKPRDFVEILLRTSYDDFVPGFATTLHCARQSHIHCIRGIALDVRRRIALELANLAEHFGAPEERGTLITLAISHETIARIVGASRQQVTQYLNEFDRAKIILREGRRIIINIEALHKVIESRP